MSGLIPPRALYYRKTLNVGARSGRYNYSRRQGKILPKYQSQIHRRSESQISKTGIILEIEPPGLEEDTELLKTSAEVIETRIN